MYEYYSPKSNRTIHQLQALVFSYTVDSNRMGLLINLHIKCFGGPPLPPSTIQWAIIHHQSGITRADEEMRAGFAFLRDPLPKLIARSLKGQSVSSSSIKTVKPGVPVFGCKYYDFWPINGSLVLYSGKRKRGGVSWRQPQKVKWKVSVIWHRN